MNLDVTIKNLGKIENAEIKVRPLTIITGTNGSGKSFFTKSLYSILSILNQNLFRETLYKDLRTIRTGLDILLDNISYKSKVDIQETEELSELISEITSELSILTELDIDLFLKSSKDFEKSIIDFRKKINKFENRLKKTKKKYNTKVERIFSVIKELSQSIEKKVSGKQDHYNEFIRNNIDSELNNNFQVRGISELISFKKDSACISINDLLDYKINSDNSSTLELKSELVKNIYSLSQVVFFESPAYWKVREALLDRKSATNFSRLRTRQLTGVPKYFYDLDSLLDSEIINNEDSCFSELTSLLEQTLSGSFKFRNGKITFIDNKSSREISKNLISYGMTNLGMVHALLKKGIISKGSFIFIDEPEANLHPSWQIILSQVLVELALNDVYVVIASHSSDMLKALEVNLKSKDNIDHKLLLSTNYFDEDGILLDLEGDNPLLKLASARSELLKPYNKLSIKASLF